MCGAVHVGVGHQDDLVVAQLARRRTPRADARAERGDQEPDFLVGQHLVVARLLRVDDLAAERQHRLRPSGRAPAWRSRPRSRPRRGRSRGAADRAPSNRRACAESPSSSRPPLRVELARLARRLARLGRPHALVGDLPRGGRVLLERLGEAVVDDLLDEPLDVGVAELGLGLPLELRVGNAHRHDRGQPLAHVVAADVALEALEEPVGLARSSRWCRSARPGTRSGGCRPRAC